MISSLGNNLSSSCPVAILGGRGMLAGAMAKVLQDRGVEFVLLARQDLDITNGEKVNSVLEECCPGVIINCAAYTNVDGAESESERAFAVNSMGSGNVAEAANRLGALMVLVSTDYVFNGQKREAYLPDDHPNPLNVYGKSKLEGEKRVREAAPNHLIIRTSWLFGPGGKNFVATMLQRGRNHSLLDVVDDQRGSPTYTPHLASGILDLVNKGVLGTWHLTNAESCTWCAFAKEIFRQAGMDVEVNPVSTEVSARPALRPRNSVLDCSATYRILENPLPSWQEALGEYLSAIQSSVGEKE